MPELLKTFLGVQKPKFRVLPLSSGTCTEVGFPFTGYSVFEQG